MKTKIMVLAAMMISVIMIAQPTGSAPQNRGVKQHDSMKSALGLSETQYASIQRIDNTYAAKKEEVWRTTSLSRDEKYEKQKLLRSAKKEEIKSVLTAEQNATWEKKKAERREMGNGPQKKANGYQGRTMKSSLSLSEEQEANMIEANTVFREKRKALLNSPDYQSIKEAHEATVKEILSEEQFKQWKQHQRNGHQHYRGRK